MKATKIFAAWPGILLACLMLVSQAAYAGVAGYAQFVNGSVQIESLAGQMRTLQKGGAVNEGDTVISAPAASAQIRMQDGGFIAVRPDTRLKFDRFIFSGKDDGSERSFFSLFKGGFRAVTGLIGRLNKSNYRITTASSTIGIRGTDHETFVVTPDSPLARVTPVGTYNKVNVGETSITTDKGTIFVLPNQMGFAGAKNQMPELKPLNTNIFTAVDRPTKEAKVDKKEAREEAKEVRVIATVDNTAQAVAAAPAAEVASSSTGTGVATNILQPITTTNGTDLSGGGPSFAAQAKAAADAAAAAASTVDFALLVDTTPATTAIGNVDMAATLAVNNAAANVTTANAITLTSTISSATANAIAAQTLANTAAGKASAALTAFNNNAGFADSTAITANNLINTPTTGAAALVQNNNALVQAAATTLPAQNTALANAQTAAASALATAQGNLLAANNTLGTANTQNGVISSNQTTITTNQSTISSNSAAMAVLTAAGLGTVAAPTSLQLAVTAASTAASQATALQAAGDFVGAQAALATAQAAQAIVNAALAANTAVISATAMANGLTNTASTTNPVNIVSTQLAAAQTAAANAAAALAVTDSTVTSSAANTLQSQAAIVTANAPIAAYNNPAVASSNFTGHLAMPAPGATSGYNIAHEQNSMQQANTQFVLDGSGNLVEMRNTSFQIQPVQSTPATSIASADVTWTGGTAADTFKLADNSIYVGRWSGATVTVTDQAAPTTPITLTPADSLWAVLLTPNSGFVQGLVGTTTYTMAGHTTPFDTAGNLGTLSSATLSADFTAQLVNATLNLTMPSGGMAGTYAVTANNMPINTALSGDSSGFKGNTPTVSCSGTCAGGGYSANVRGSFAGTAAASAGLGYDIWPTVTAGPVTDLVQGLVAFSTTTAPTVAPYAAYNPNYIEVETAGGLSFNSGMMAKPADLVYITGGTGNVSTSGALQSVTFRDIGGGGNYTQTSAITPGTAASADAPSFATTGIQYGAWTGYTGQSNTWSQSLGGKNGGAPDSWMYGPEGYADASNGWLFVGTSAGTFSYQMDGATAPKSQNTGLTGTLTSASFTVNFAALTLSGNMMLTMPGNENWGASVTNATIVAGSPFNATPVVTYGVGVPATTCSTCSGNVNGLFTGQNFAGAILSYDLYNNAALGGGDVSGNVALTRNYAGNTNPSVINGAAAPTGNIVVATAGNGSGSSSVSTYPVGNSITTGNLLTAYGSSGTGYSNSTTVTCTTCTTNPSGQVATSGIYYGTWDAGTYAQAFSSTFTAGMMTPSYWITGPEAGPLYLPQALIGTATYAFNAGQVSNSMGTTGTVAGTTALTLDFSKQTVGIILDVSIADTATSAPSVHIWNATTLPGNEAVLGNGKGIGGGAFYASTYNNGGGSGLLTVSVDGLTTNVTNPSGNINGQLTGTGLTGAIMSFNLGGQLASSYENINGVAAFTGTAQSVATPHQYVLMSLADPFSPVPLPVLGFYANAPSRVTTDASGNLTQFDIQTINGGGGSSTVTNVSPTNVADHGTDPVSGISWGRWAGGTFNVTDRASGAVTPVTKTGSLHWIAEPVSTSAVTLPTSGTYTYTNAGGTLPTDNLGNVGTLNSATLSANFTAQTVNVGVNATVAGATLNAAGTSVPIIQNTVFYASSLEPATSTSHLAVTCTGTCGAALGGAVIGKFTGAGAIGAAMSYGLQNGATTISGVTAFHR